MNFTCFHEARPLLLAKNPDALDLTETRVVPTLGRHRPEPTEEQRPERAHRCHLAEFWLETFGLPAAWKRRALVTRGVRDSLAHLFADFAAQGLRIALPADVYPVYHDLARAAGAKLSTYTTIPTLDAAAFAAADILLVCNPVKPRGSYIAGAELGAILAWLAGDSRRRVVIDAVYTFATRFDPWTLRLLGTGQVILLHSLAKAWLRPLVMGVMLVPAADVETWTPVVRAQRSDPNDLRLAHALLTRERAFPAQLAGHLGPMQSKLRAALAARGLRPAIIADPAARYLFLLDQPWEELLQHHGVLALPLSVFGGTADLSVASALPFA